MDNAIQSLNISRNSTKYSHLTGGVVRLQLLMGMSFSNLARDIMRVRGITLCLVFAIGASCVPASPAPNFEGLDTFLDSLAAAHGIPGYAFAAFDDQNVLHERIAGYKNQDTKEAVGAETVFEAASISKPVFAYIVLTLARTGAMDLDAPIGTAEPVLAELGHDERSAILTPRVLLAHLGGLPNWRSRLNFQATSYEELFSSDDTLQFIFDPDTEYRYSGEGYVLLQQVVEDAARRELNALAKEMVFGPLGMTRTSFLFDESMQTNASSGHDQDLRPDKWEISLALASSTLHTTATDLARFGAHVASGIRRHEYYAALAEPAVTVDSTVSTKISWGLGLGVVADEDGTYIYHGGNNVIFIADFIYGFEENLGYALLTNSANGRAMVEGVEQRIFGKDIVRP